MPDVAWGRASCASSVCQSRRMGLKIILSVVAAPCTRLTHSISTAPSKGWIAVRIATPNDAVRARVMGAIIRPRRTVMDRIFLAISVSPAFLAEGVESIQVSWFPIPQKRAGFRRRCRFSRSVAQPAVAALGASKRALRAVANASTLGASARRRTASDRPAPETSACAVMRSKLALLGLPCSAFA
jgi:hypothetical protein